MESLSLSFVNSLRCPLTLKGLSLVGPEDFARIGLSEALDQHWSGALLRSDQCAAYPVRDGIPVLLAEEIRLLPVPASHTP